MNTLIKNAIDEGILQYIEKSGHEPRAIYLTIDDMIAFADELDRISYMPSRPSRLVCPHCGESLFEYSGIPVRTLKKGEVVIG